MMTCVSGLSNQTGDEAVTGLELNDISFDMHMYSHLK